MSSQSKRQRDEETEAVFRRPARHESDTWKFLPAVPSEGAALGDTRYGVLLRFTDGACPGCVACQ